MITKRGYKIWIPELMEVPKGEYRELLLEESLHGEIPSGYVKFTKSDIIGIYEDVIDINIHLHSSRVGQPYQLKMKAHIYNITTDIGYVYYHFMICTRDFIKTTRIRTLGNSMESAVRTLYYGNVNSDVKSDVNNHRFQQSNMTDYNYLKSILSSYNKNIVWGFSCEGLLIKKVTDKPKYENYPHGFSGSNSKQLSLNRSKLKEIPIPKINQFTYFSSISFNGNIQYTELKDHMYEDNKLTNEKYRVTPKATVDVPYGEFPPYDIGDIAKLSRKMLVLSRKLILTESLNVVLTYGEY